MMQRSFRMDRVCETPTALGRSATVDARWQGHRVSRRQRRCIWRPHSSLCILAHDSCCGARTGDRSQLPDICGRRMVPGPAVEQPGSDCPLASKDLCHSTKPPGLAGIEETCALFAARRSNPTLAMGTKDHLQHVVTAHDHRGWHYTKARGQGGYRLCRGWTINPQPRDSRQETTLAVIIQPFNDLPAQQSCCRGVLEPMNPNTPFNMLLEAHPHHFMQFFILLLPAGSCTNEYWSPFGG